MSRTRIVGGKITEIVGGDYNIYSASDIIFNSGKSVIPNGKQGVVIGNILTKAPKLNIVYPEVVDVYFAMAKNEGNKITFQKVNNAKIYDIIYVIVETKHLKEGHIINVRLHQYSKKYHSNTPFIIQQEGKDTEIIKMEVGNYKNKGGTTNQAIAKIELFSADKTIQEKYNEEIKNSTEKKLQIFMEVDTDGDGKMKCGVCYNLKEYYRDFEDDSNFWYKGDGKWFEVEAFLTPWMEYAKAYTESLGGMKIDERETQGQIIIQNWIDLHNKEYGYENVENDKKPIVSYKNPWCGIFVHRMLSLSGMKVEKGKSWENPSLAKFFYANWKNSKEIQSLMYGAIVVMSYGHVAFVYDFNDTYVWLLGGNQSDVNGQNVSDGVMINVKKNPRSKIVKIIIPINT